MGDGRTEQRVARRARILLAMADPTTIVSELAERLDLDRTSIWALCRRYESVGVDGVLDAPRSGRPREFSPLHNLCALLPQLLGDHREARRIHLIWDNGPSHTSRQTRDFLRNNSPHVRVLFTPAHASWLNQAELLLRAFGARYLERGNWACRFELIGVPTGWTRSSMGCAARRPCPSGCSRASRSARG